MLATIETRGNGGRLPETVTWGAGQKATEMAIADVRDGFAAWRLWGRMGWNDILQRYRRSLLGPFWLTANLSNHGGSAGAPLCRIVQHPNSAISSPFLCTGLLVWNLLATFLSEGGMIFTATESYVMQVRLPYSIYVYRSSWSKIIIFAHNFVIYFGVLIYFGIWPGATALLAIPGLILLVLNGTLATVYIGILSARFRDIPPLISSVVQLIFFVTPIMWKPELLQRQTYIADINPFFHLIEIVRTPLLGNVPDLKNYLTVLSITVVNLGLAGLVFTRFRSRIAYWI